MSKRELDGTELTPSCRPFSLTYGGSLNSVVSMFLGEVGGCGMRGYDSAVYNTSGLSLPYVMSTVRQVLAGKAMRKNHHLEFARYDIKINIEY